MMECVFCKTDLAETAKTCPNCSKPAYFGVELEDLEYTVLSPALAEEIPVKKGLFGGDLKKFVQCIADGNAWTTPVILDETFFYTDDDLEVYCANLSDRWGRPCERAVHMLDSLEFMDILDGEDIEGNTANGVLLRFQIGKKTTYILLNEESAKNLPSRAKEIANATPRDPVIRKCLAVDTPRTYMNGLALARFIKMHGGNTQP